MGGGLDAEADLSALDAQYGDGDLVANVQRFLRMAGQNQHPVGHSGWWLHVTFLGVLVGTRVSKRPAPIKVPACCSCRYAQRVAVACAGSVAGDEVLTGAFRFAWTRRYTCWRMGEAFSLLPPCATAHLSTTSTMTRSKSPSLMREFALAIVPLFFGVYLFAGLLETYKDDMSSRKDLVLDFYRPMREAQADCRATEQQLMVAYGTQAGTYKLMLGEWDHMVSADPATLTRDYDVLPRSLIESNNKVSAQVADLKAKLDTCIPALFRKYEEVALATATYDRFIDIARQRDSNLRTPCAKRAALLDEAASKFKPESMMDTLRQSLTLDADGAAGRADIKVKLHALGDPAADLYMQLAQSEQAILKVEQDTDVQLIGLFAKEVNRRYKRGLLSVLWPW